jgi:hypothetical protein
VSNDPQAVFDGLVRERGGSQAFDQTQLAVARKLAQLLADDGEVSGSTLTTLVSLLPPKPGTDEPEYDLSRLSDREFAELDRLTAIAAGLKPSKPDKPRRHPQRSYRQIWAEIHAVAIDQIEGEQAHARRCKRPWLLSETDRIELRNAACFLFGLLALPAQVFAEEIEGAVAAHKVSAVPAAVLETPVVEQPGPVVEQPKVEQPSANVVPMVGLFSTPRHCVGENRPEARSSDLPRGRW